MEMDVDANGEGDENKGFGRDTTPARGSAASATLIPNDPDRPVIEYGDCLYPWHNGRGRVDIHADASPTSDAPPGQPGWELVVGDVAGAVRLSGVIEPVERGVKISRYAVHSYGADPGFSVAVRSGR